MSTTITLNSRNWSIDTAEHPTYDIAPGKDVTVEFDSFPTSGDDKYRFFEDFKAVQQVEAWPRTQDSVTEYDYDGSYLSLNGEVGTIIPQYPAGDHSRVERSGTVEWYPNVGRVKPWVNGTAIGYRKNTLSGNMRLVTGGSALQLFITLSDDLRVLVPVLSPANTHVDRTKALKLSWSYTDNDMSWAMPTQAGATVTWKIGADGEEHTATVSGTTQTYTIPLASMQQVAAGDVLYWKVRAVSRYSVAADAEYETAYAPLYTEDGTAVATPVSPVDEIIDAQSPTVFRWRHSTPYGTVQTGAHLQWSTDGTAWQELATISSSADTYTAPAGTFGAGALYWRVRTKNADGVYGSWSAAVACTVVGPPLAPVVTISGGWRPLVSWSAAGQEGYQVQLAGWDSGPLWGSANAWRAPDYLPAGTYTARVRIVGSYGLWSEWGEANVTLGTPGSGTITLRVSGTESPILTWTASRTCEAFWIYRDGEKIGETTASPWQDFYAAAGPHVYMVRGIYSNGNRFIQSAEVEVTVAFSSVILMDVETGERIPLPTVRENELSIRQRVQRNTAFYHWNGSGRPSAEIGQQITRTVTLRPTWPRGMWDEMPKLEAYMGRLVHFRDPYGRALYGIISALPSEAMPWRHSFDLEIREVEP